MSLLTVRGHKWLITFNNNERVFAEVCRVTSFKIKSYFLSQLIVLKVYIDKNTNDSKIGRKALIVLTVFRLGFLLN